ncbi:MAG: class I SAM-dependent methyltransferase [Alphaproteobacteria bacterium]|nr:class I SAM-dependent methyltransferase [Alphaproteobacteria bacterium]MDE2492793.1 class I SAM-dependent methyltransferase [Alphaproteobacteria bacterium]
MTRVPQAMQPHGFWGHVFGWLMDRFNASSHNFAFKRLEVHNSDRVLEIGFGTGRLARKLAKAARDGLVGGVDPSELMLQTAEKRTRKFRKKGRVELKLGDASSLPWPDATFDKAAALHSFQFWRDPACDLVEIRRVLKPDGLLLLLLRTHKKAGPKWLPNPISRSGQEIAGALQLLTDNGFVGTRLEGKVGSSAILTARKAV